MSLQILKQRILELSFADNFNDACLEWDYLYSDAEKGQYYECPCGQEILERCYIKNRITGSLIYVGNVCIKRFMGMDIQALVDGLCRIKRNITGRANPAVIQYATEAGLLSCKEREFLLGVVRKRKESYRQQAWRVLLNQRILAYQEALRLQTAQPMTMEQATALFT